MTPYEKELLETLRQAAIVAMDEAWLGQGLNSAWELGRDLRSLEPKKATPEEVKAFSEEAECSIMDAQDILRQCNGDKDMALKQIEKMRRPGYGLVFGKG